MDGLNGMSPLFVWIINSVGEEGFPLFDAFGMGAVHIKVCRFIHNLNYFHLDFGGQFMKKAFISDMFTQIFIINRML
jgi:hypothetical protein